MPFHDEAAEAALNRSIAEELKRHPASAPVPDETEPGSSFDLGDLMRERDALRLQVADVTRKLDEATEQSDEWHRLYETHRSKENRWETGFRSIVTIAWGARKEFEIADIVEYVRGIVAERDDLRLDRGKILLLNADQAVDNTKLREERDALAAALVQFGSLVEPIRKHGGYFEKPHTMTSIRGREYLELHALVDAVYKVDAAPFLAERDKRVRREALEEAANKLGDVTESEVRHYNNADASPVTWPATVSLCKAKLRRMAEEHKPAK